MNTDAKKTLEQVIAVCKAGRLPDATMIKELTLAVQQFQKLEEKVRVDGLTQVYNRDYFNIRIHEQVLHSGGLSLLMIDIDYFKAINDTYGHQRGDEILFNVAQTLKRYTRKQDAVYRYGGEEFVVVLPHTNEEEAVQVMEKLRVKVSEETMATVSIGGAFYSGDQASYAQLISKADQALYQAKAAGRNCSKLYQPDQSQIRKVDYAA